MEASELAAVALRSDMLLHDPGQNVNRHCSKFFSVVIIMLVSNTKLVQWPVMDRYHIVL